MPIKIKLRDDWRGVYKLLSVWWAAAISTLLGVIAANPNIAATAWAMIPEDLRPDVGTTGKVAIAAFTAFATFVAAVLVKQPIRTSKITHVDESSAPPGQ